MSVTGDAIETPRRPARPARRWVLTLLWSLSVVWWLAIAVFGAVMAVVEGDDPIGLGAFGVVVAVVAGALAAVHLMFTIRAWQGRSGRAALVIAAILLGLSALLLLVRLSLWIRSPWILLVHVDPATLVAFAGVAVNLTIVILVRRDRAAQALRPEPDTSTGR